MPKIIKAARGRVTGHFGATNVPGAHVKRHAGTDIGHGEMTAADREVFAPCTGTVTAVGRLGTYGNRIEIDMGGGWSSLLAHLDEVDGVPQINVDVGDHVTIGDLDIAVMGDTGGDWPVHLHQELRYRGVPVDAEPHFVSIASLTPTALPTAPQQEEDEMPFGYYAKCPEYSNTFWVSQTTGKKRPVSLGELQAAQKFNLETKGIYGTGYVVELSKGSLDSIPNA